MNIIDRIRNWKRKVRWNKQYKEGRWDNLNNEIEQVRYKTVVEFAAKHGKSNPDILALGCGEGILLDNLQSINYNSFLGMDFSAVSINKAKSKNHLKSKFICADIHSFKPQKKYDVIVFNEIFYYIVETEKSAVLKTMLSHLNEGGILIISIFREGLGCWEYFNRPQLNQLEFETVKTNKELTYWKIGTYKKV